MKTLCLTPEVFSRSGLEKIYGDFKKASGLLDAEAVFIRVGTKIDSSFLAQAPCLKAVVSVATGTDHIDLKACEEKKISVLSLKGETSFLSKLPNTAEHSFSLLLSLLRHTANAHASILQGNWEQAPHRGRTLRGLRYGIVGYGRLGKIAGEIAQGFGMKVLAYDPNLKKVGRGVTKKKTLVDLARGSDILAIFASLTEENPGLVSAKVLGALPQNAVVVNVARGALIDEGALLGALKSGKIRGAALDVLTTEPPRSGSSLELVQYSKSHPHRLILTPHIGGQTEEAVELADRFMIAQFQKWTRKSSRRK